MYKRLNELKRKINIFVFTKLKLMIQITIKLDNYKNI